MLIALFKMDFNSGFFTSSSLLLLHLLFFRLDRMLVSFIWFACCCCCCFFSIAVCVSFFSSIVGSTQVEFPFLLQKFFFSSLWKKTLAHFIGLCFTFEHINCTVLRTNDTQRETNCLDHSICISDIYTANIIIKR